MINANSIHFRFKFMATIYYWSLRLRDYPIAKPRYVNFGLWRNALLVECD